MNEPTDASGREPNPDPIQDVRAHLELALAALDRLREVLPPPQMTRPPHGEAWESA